MKLTKVQNRALSKLTNEWQTPKQLNESETALDGLFVRDLAQRKAEYPQEIINQGQTWYRLLQR